MLLTIIIPTYNSNRKLRRLLSTIPQKDNLEIIVVDDNGQEDPELDLKCDFPKVIFIKNKFGKAAGGARNTGLDVAQGHYMLFADSDDLFIEGFEEKILPYLENKLFDVVYFSPESFIEGDLEKSGKRHLR